MTSITSIIGIFAYSEGPHQVIVEQGGSLLLRTTEPKSRAKLMTPSMLANLDEEINEGVANWVRRPSEAGFELLINHRDA